MSSRNGSQLIAGALLVVGGAVLGIVAVKVPDYLQAEPPAPAPNREPLVHPHKGASKHKFLEDVRFTGSLGAGGWTGAATWKNSRGYSAKLGSKISPKGGVEKIEMSASRKAHDWEWNPDMEVSATKVPGKPGVKYQATLGKPLNLPMDPSFKATASNEGLTLGAAFSKAVSKGLDVDVDLTLPLTKDEVSFLFDTKTSLKVGKGKVVYKLGGKFRSPLAAWRTWGRSSDPDADEATYTPDDETEPFDESSGANLKLKYDASYDLGI